jgi:hypothetical protein
MSRTHRSAAGIFLLALCLFPREARADFWDMIWEMSGPQMAGYPLFNMKVDLQTGRVRVVSFATKHPEEDSDDNPKDPTAFPAMRIRNYWLSLPVIAYVSTPKDSDTATYKAMEAALFAFDPMVDFNIKRWQNGDVMLYAGGGMSVAVITGPTFKAKQNTAVKIRPFGLKLWDWDASFNIRWYADGFEASDFGKPSLPLPPGVDRAREMVFGWSFGKAW